MPKTVRYETVTPHVCTECGRLIGQTGSQKAWIMPGWNACKHCYGDIAALVLAALYDGLEIVHVTDPK